MKTRFLPAAVAGLWLAALGAVPAQADEGWVITSFHSDIRINGDSSLNITETIALDFGAQQHHGIFRYIPVRYRYNGTQDRYYDVTVTSVTQDATQVPYTTPSDPNNFVLKIGDPNFTISGAHRYVIAYHVAGAMNAFPDHDELYWNVDGAGWPVPKQSVSATVSLPQGAYKSATCYQGASGSTQACNFQGTGNVVTYTATRQLGSGEQLTIVTGLVKGAVSVPAPFLEAKARQFPQDAFDVNLGTVFVSLLILVAGLGLIVRFWWLHGRDREYLTQYYLTNDTRDEPARPFRHEPVVVEFGPPQNLRPAELGLILDESADTKDVTATIVDLAVRGVLTISEVPAEKDWTLTWRANDVTGILPFERTLLDGLFAGGRQQVRLSELKGTFRPTLQAAQGLMYSDAMSRKLFQTRPDYLRAGRIGLGVLLIGLGGFLAFLLGKNFGWGLPGAAIVVLGVALIATYRFMSVRTAAGHELLHRTLGFRLYMSTAEKYRQQFAEKAEIFTQLLPYAIVFGCVTRWAKAFEGIDTSKTDGWYVGSRPFQAALIASSLESMNSSISTAVASTPAGSGSSGFGGGGFSGGGGGGGGGGAW
ncbi:MAG TPA: DUF2207 domain-containing protein [Candidatus Dormibacteraeota bacterium]|nr:DUF2207 domain-containing protein [Candidatus Dormibacteraeota bacterium]